MAVYHGRGGAVYVGTNAVAAVQDWSYNEEDPAPADQLSMGDTTVTPVASGAKKGSSTINVLMDMADTTGQVALTTGASVTLNLYPEGNTTGRNYRTGTAIVRTIADTSNVTGLNTRTITLDGVMATGTAA